ncbi:hypothetical protein BGP_6348 [Beggiatoa sp. PS]|nr:hypothetical protein BGP_6348 [Beggiatoa sp. PS]
MDDFLPPKLDIVYRPYVIFYGTLIFLTVYLHCSVLSSQLIIWRYMI